MNRISIAVTTVVLGFAMCGCRTPPPIPVLAQRSVLIEVQTVLMDTTDIGELSKGQMITPGLIANLRKAGKATLVTAEVVTAFPGKEASLRGVTEYIYPTEFAPSAPEEKNPKVNVNVSVQETTVVPSSFATREVGHILTVLPSLQDTNKVRLQFARQSVQPPQWLSYPDVNVQPGGETNAASCSQPVFRVAATTTEVIVSPGQPIVISAHPQPNAENKTFVTLLVVNIMD